MYEVEFYTDEKGRCFVVDFLDEIQVKIRAKFVKWIEKLEREGPNLPRPYADIVRRIIITHGFLKKGDRIPVGEIERAERIMYNSLQRHKGG